MMLCMCDGLLACRRSLSQAPPSGCRPEITLTGPDAVVWSRARSIQRQLRAVPSLPPSPVSPLAGSAAASSRPSAAVTAAVLAQIEPHRLVPKVASQQASLRDDFGDFLRERFGFGDFRQVHPRHVIEWLAGRAATQGRPSRSPLIRQIRALLDEPPVTSPTTSDVSDWMASSSVVRDALAIQASLNLLCGEARWNPATYSGNPCKSAALDNFLEAYRKMRTRGGHDSVSALEIMCNDAERIVRFVRERIARAPTLDRHVLWDTQLVAAICLLFAVGDRRQDAIHALFNFIVPNPDPAIPVGESFLLLNVADKSALLSARSRPIKAQELRRNAEYPELCVLQALINLIDAYRMAGVAGPDEGLIFKKLRYGDIRDVHEPMSADALSQRFAAAARDAGLPDLRVSGLRRGSVQELEIQGADAAQIDYYPRPLAWAGHGAALPAAHALPVGAGAASATPRCRPGLAAVGADCQRGRQRCGGAFFLLLLMSVGDCGK